MSSGKKSHKSKKVKHEKEDGPSRSVKRAKSESPKPGPSHVKNGENGYMVRLKILNPYLTCGLCEGYLIDAITIMDCLHTFCKSCLLLYFEEKNDCPKCHFVIHQSHPTHYVTYDRTLQEIVYKLVPGLLEAEQQRRKEFEEKNKGKSSPDEIEKGAEEEGQSGKKKAKKVKKCASDDTTPTETGSPAPQSSNNKPTECCQQDTTHTSHHRTGDRDAVILQPADGLPPLKMPVLMLSHVKCGSGGIAALTTVTCLKRVIAYQLHNGDVKRHNEYDIFCNDELMGRDYSVVFIRKTRLRTLSPSEPLPLVYKRHLEF